MNPKIRWYVQNGGSHPVITAEISLGMCGRYIEHQTIPYWGHLVDQKSVLACTIERVQKNMEDVLDEFEN